MYYVPVKKSWCNRLFCNFETPHYLIIKLVAVIRHTYQQEVICPPLIGVFGITLVFVAYDISIRPPTAFKYQYYKYTHLTNKVSKHPMKALPFIHVFKVLLLSAMLGLFVVVIFHASTGRIHLESFPPCVLVVAIEKRTEDRHFVVADHNEYATAHVEEQIPQRIDSRLRRKLLVDRQVHSGCQVLVHRVSLRLAGVDIISFL